MPRVWLGGSSPLEISALMLNRGCQRRRRRQTVAGIRGDRPGANVVRAEVSELPDAFVIEIPSQASLVAKGRQSLAPKVVPNLPLPFRVHTSRPCDRYPDNRYRAKRWTPPRTRSVNPQKRRRVIGRVVKNPILSRSGRTAQRVDVPWADPASDLDVRRNSDRDVWPFANRNQSA